MITSLNVNAKIVIVKIMSVKRIRRPKMESKIFTKTSDGFQVNKFDVSKGAVTAVVTSFKNLDVVNDRILPGALDDYLKGFGGGLPMLFQHTSNEIIGVWNKLSIEGDKVIGNGQIFSEVSKGSDTMVLMSKGLIGATSIGFTSSDYDKNEDGGIDFKKIELKEISMVMKPANPKAQVISAKNDEGRIDIRKVESILREAGLSRNESKALLSKGQTGLREVDSIETEKLNVVANLTNLLKEV